MILRYYIDNGVIYCKELVENRPTNDSLIYLGGSGNWKFYLNNYTNLVFDHNTKSDSFKTYNQSKNPKHSFTVVQTIHVGNVLVESPSATQFKEIILNFIKFINKPIIKISNLDSKEALFFERQHYMRINMHPIFSKFFKLGQTPELMNMYTSNSPSTNFITINNRRYMIQGVSSVIPKVVATEALTKADKMKKSKLK